MAVPKFSGLGQAEPYRYGNIYERVVGDGWARLEIGPDDDHVGLLLRLTNHWSTPDYWLLYVSLSSHTGRQQGRYYSPLIDEAELAAFLLEFRELLEGFGGQRLWIGHPEGPDLLVYDQHDVIYAYGDVDAFESVLQERGFVAGQVRIPAPHTHGFDPSLTSREDRLFAHFDWLRRDLKEGDDL